MAILDFIKNRNQAVSAPASEQSGPKPETAKQMYTRMDAEQKSSTPPVAGMDAAESAKARSAGEEIKAYGTERAAAAPSPTSTPAPAGGAENPQPMIQPMEGQDKGAPALSPTTGQAGVKETELPTTPSPTPSPSPTTPKPTRSPSPDL